VKKDYYLKGVGVYKTVITTSASSYATEESSTISNYSQTFTYPSPETKETLIYEYSTRNLSPTDFSEVTLPSSNSGSMNSPQVTNISYSQRIDQNGSRTKLVDIHYDLDGNRSMYVEFFFSYDGGLSYPVICTGMSGDAGAGVQKGLSKKALWDVSADWDQKLNLHARIMIKATYGDQPTGLPSLGGSSVFQEPSE
jgi:hypothetical protein